jgi:4-coumarate--CoA ligase
MTDMSGIVKAEPLDVPLPDDLTVVQFILDTFDHPTKPNRDGVPWFVDNDSGKTVGYEEVGLH